MVGVKKEESGMKSGVECRIEGGMEGGRERKERRRRGGRRRGNERRVGRGSGVIEGEHTCSTDYQTWNERASVVAHLNHVICIIVQKEVSCVLSVVAFVRRLTSVARLPSGRSGVLATLAGKINYQATARHKAARSAVRVVHSCSITG